MSLTYKNMNLMIYSEIWNEFINGVGFINDGFLNFVKILLNNFKRNGGNILYNAEVEKIIVKENKVIGIKTRKGVYKSKYFILVFSIERPWFFY